MSDVPANEVVLRRLFWKLFFRGRGLNRRRGQEGTLNRSGIAGTLLYYFMIGAFLCPLAFTAGTSTFATVLHGMALFMVVFQMVLTASSVLFNKEESEILLHRPVTARELLRSKVAVLCAYSAIFAGTLSLPGMVVGAWLRDNTGWFPLAHFCSMLLMIIFSVGALVVVYQACLIWFGRERLDAMMTTMQTVLTVIMVMSSQSYRFIAHLNLDKMNHSWWLLATPPMWFGSLDTILSARVYPTILLVPAAMSIVATALLAWVGFHRLAATYTEGLMSLNEGATAPARKVGKSWLALLLKIPPLRWWVRDPVERSAFLLAGAYFLRDREIKLRLYPAIGQILIMPVVFLFTDNGGWGVGFAAVYLGWLPMMALQNLEYSEQWRAADLFQFTPGGAWQRLFHGVRKAALALIALPALAVMAIVVSIVKRGDPQIVLLLPSLVIMPVWSLVPGMLNPWLPLSKPLDARKQGNRGCIMMSIVMGVSALLSAGAAFSWHEGWFPWFMAGESAIALSVFFILKKIIAGSGEWQDA